MEAQLPPGGQWEEDFAVPPEMLRPGVVAVPRVALLEEVLLEVVLPQVVVERAPRAPRGLVVRYRGVSKRSSRGLNLERMAGYPESLRR